MYRICLSFLLCIVVVSAFFQSLMEAMDRGLVALPDGKGNVLSVGIYGYGSGCCCLQCVSQKIRIQLAGNTSGKASKEVEMG